MFRRLCQPVRSNGVTSPPKFAGEVEFCLPSKPGKHHFVIQGWGHQRATEAFQNITISAST